MMQNSLFDAAGTRQEPQETLAAANGELDSLRPTVLECRKCRLAATRKTVVFGEGDPHARLLVIGEAPGADEDAQGRPFVGRSGQLLDKILLSVGFQRSDVYIANIIKCRPPENRNPMPDEVECCKPWLTEQIEIIRPKILLLLGRVSANTILDNKLSMSAMRGSIVRWKGLDCVVTYHPAALLRNPNWKRPCWDDMKMLRAHYDKLLAND